MRDLRTPTPDELERYAAVHHVDISEDEHKALADIDVLVVPTMLQTAHERPANSSRLQLLDRAVNVLENTAPFDAAGYPALSVSAGPSDGLPVRLMFVGEAFEDATVLRRVAR